MLLPEFSYARLEAAPCRLPKQEGSCSASGSFYDHTQRKYLRGGNLQI